MYSVTKKLGSSVTMEKGQEAKSTKFTTSIPSVVRTIEWNLENFKRLVKDKESIESLKLDFQVKNTFKMPSEWTMYFQLAEDGDSFGPFLSVHKLPSFRSFDMDKVNKVIVKYQLLINSGILGKEISVGPKESDFKTNSWGCWRLLSHAALIDPKSNYLPNGTLTVKLRMELFGDKVVNTEVTDKNKTAELLLQTSRLSVVDEISKLLESGLNSDLVIRTKDLKLFHVHRNILGARCPVFKAMFAADIVENSEGLVEVSDVGSKAMGILLKYLYSGVLDGSWIEAAEEIVYAADKYDLTVLKTFCDQGFIRAVRPESVMSQFAVAKRHGLDTAIHDIITFVSKNAESCLEAFLDERSVPEDEQSSEDVG